MAEIEMRCAAYFWAHQGFHRCMEELFRLCSRYGCVQGRICIENATQEERDALEGLFGKPFPEKISLRGVEFANALKSTPFGDADIKTVVECYFGKTISTRRQRKDQREDRMAALLAWGRTIAQGDTAERFLDAMEEKRTDRGYALLAKEAEASPDAIREYLSQVLQAADLLDRRMEEPLRLAVFSAQATRDPHALDADRVAGKLFLHLLALRWNVPCPQSAEERDALYLDSGILCDSISSTVTQLGLILESHGEEHPAFGAFRHRWECATLSLTNLAALTAAKSPSGRVYIVENQMVFAQLCDHAKEFHSPLICTSGQLQVAALRLLDLLASSGTALFYAGDFDGGGLSIALRLQNRYSNLRLWHMTEQDYLTCRSQVRLSGSSLALLKQTNGTSLEPLAELLRDQGYAGYQELLLEKLLEDLVKTEAV